MPDSKKPFIRYQVIDRCIRNSSKRYSFKELLEEVNQELDYRGLNPIGKTSFYQDIKDMQVEFQAPIETYQDGNRKYYRYANPDYSFGNQPLNQGEIDHLKDAALILSRFAGIPGFEWIDEIVNKLQLGTLEHVSDRNVISFESNEFLKGREFIEPIFKAITRKKALSIDYKAFTNSEVKIHTLHPYHLKEYDSRWYVFGYYPKRDTLMTLSVDRMEGVMEIDDEFIENERFDFQEYFEDMIGIRKEEGQEELEVELKFSPLMANYVETKPIHGSQRVLNKLDDGSLVIKIQVIPNFELENLIFSFKDGVEVLSPKSLRERIGELYHEALVKYQ